MAGKRCLGWAVLLLCVLIQQVSSANDWDLLDLDTIEDLNNPFLVQAALRKAHAQRLADLESLERVMDSQIKTIQKRKYDITAQKRQHYACLVHVLSCYKRRR